MLGLDHKPLTS